MLTPQTFQLECLGLLKLKLHSEQSHLQLWLAQWRRLEPAFQLQPELESLQTELGSPQLELEFQALELEFQALVLEFQALVLERAAAT